MEREHVFKFLGRHFIRWWWKVVVLVLLLAAGRSVVGDWSEVPSRSMVPTIVPGDRIYVNKLAYGLRVPFTRWWVARWREPRRGEVVTLLSPRDGAVLVKRVVGGPGDVVEGVAVAEGEYFVMGDNRDHSVDSRAFGLVDRGDILGRVPRVIFSVDPEGYWVPRRGRFFVGVR